MRSEQPPFEGALTIEEACDIAHRTRRVIARACRLGYIGGRTQKAGPSKTDRWWIDIDGLRAHYPKEFRGTGKRPYHKQTLFEAVAPFAASITQEEADRLDRHAEEGLRRNAEQFARLEREEQESKAAGQ